MTIDVADDAEDKFHSGSVADIGDDIIDILTALRGVNSVGWLLTNLELKMLMRVLRLFSQSVHC